MADDQAPTVDTPEQTANTPESGTGTQEQTTNWQERYDHLRPEFTRATQDRDRYRQEAEEYKQLVAALQDEDPAARLAAAERLGLQLIDEDDTQSDPQEQLARELAELKQWRDEFTGAQQQEQYVATIEQSVEQQLEQIGGLTDKQKDWIVSRAIALPPTQEGLPDIQAAHAEFSELINTEKQSWAKTKPRSAFTSATGKEGTQVPDLNDRQQRVDWMLSKLQADQE